MTCLHNIARVTNVFNSYFMSKLNSWQIKENYHVVVMSQSGIYLSLDVDRPRHLFTKGTVIVPPLFEIPFIHQISNPICITMPIITTHIHTRRYTDIPCRRQQKCTSMRPRSHHLMCYHAYDACVTSHSVV